jgi:Phage tail lysozyme
MPPLGGFFLRGSMTQRQQSAFRLFRAAGYSPKGAAVIVGGDSRESGINLVSGYQDKTDHGSQGIAQWRLGRLAALEQFCTVNHLASGTLAAQVSFQIYELGKDYPILDRRLRDRTAPGRHRARRGRTAYPSCWRCATKEPRGSPPLTTPPSYTRRSPWSAPPNR